MSVPQGVSRRGLLAGIGAAGATLALPGCTTESPAPPPPPDPDDLLRAAAIVREESLLQAYDEAVRAAPALAVRLVLLREHHTAHLEALRGPPPATATPSGPGSSVPSPPAGPSTTPPAAPPTDGDTLAALVAAENTAGASHAQAALAAGGRELASLLAVLSASEQSHPVALT